MHVPLQAVVPVEGKHYCFVDKGGASEKREVTIGEFNEEFIEIKSGVAAGEKVALRTPSASDASKNAKPSGDKPAAEKTKTDAAPKPPK